MANMEEMFPEHEEIFGGPVTTVRNAASSGVVNDWEAHFTEQVAAIRALIASPPGKCEWAAAAVQYLLDAGCCADDKTIHSA